MNLPLARPYSVDNPSFSSSYKCTAMLYPDAMPVTSPYTSPSISVTVLLTNKSRAAKTYELPLL